MPDHAARETGIADDDGEQYGGRDRQGNAEPRRQAPIGPEQRRDVGPEPHERAVPEGDEAEPAHQGPGGIDEGPDQDLDHEMQEIARRDERHGDQDRGADGEQDAIDAHGVNSPRGRMNISTMKNTKANT